MGTKNNPGNFDCYANADPDEPMFILLARDKDAPGLIELWADVREENGEDPAKVKEARDCAASMVKWFDEKRRWQCMKCVQEKAGLTATVPAHSPRCPQRSPSGTVFDIVADDDPAPAAGGT